jgi:hypothetical protein
VGVSAPAAEAAAESSEAGPFTPAMSLILILVGVFAFSALIVLFTYAPDLRTGNNGDAHALSKSAIGFAGLVEAERFSGAPVLVSRQKLPHGRHSGLFVATPPREASYKSITGLPFEGLILVVLPKWAVTRDQTHIGWVQKIGLLEGPSSDGSLWARARPVNRKDAISPALTAAAGPFTPGARIEEGKVENLQIITGKGWIPVLTDQFGETVLARDPDGPIFVLSDPDLLNNQGLKSAATLTGALGILGALRSGEGPIIFDVTLNGLGHGRSVLRLLFDPPFLAVTLCLAAAAALAGIQAFCRFGPIRRGGRVLALGKEALADNSAALVRLAGREHRMGGRYADLTRDLAARAVGAPRDLGGEALTAFLDRLGAQRGATDRLGELTVLARTAPDRARLIAVAEKLFRWRLEMTRERI